MVDAPPVVIGKDQAAHLVRVHEALNVIHGCEVFAGIVDSTPLDIKEGGKQTPYSAKDMQYALACSDGGEYRCGGNVFWLEHTWLCNHRVPFNEQQIKALQAFFPHDKPPASSPFDFWVAVEHNKINLHEHRGSLQRVSPEEVGHAMLFSIAEAIKAGVPSEVLGQWKTLALTVPFVITVVEPGEARYWKAQNLRESMVEKGETLKRTVRQRIFDVAGFKIEKEKTDGNLSSEKVASMYAKHLKLARSSEPISKAFVDCAVTIHKRILADDANAELLAWCDNHFTPAQHPFHSIYILQCVCDKCSTAAKIGFVMAGIVDHVRMGYISSSDLVISKLKDSKNSYCNVLCLKQDTRSYLLNEFLDSLNMKGEYKHKLREVLGDFSTVRKSLTSYDEDAHVDMSWQVGLPTSALLLTGLVEDMVYMNTFDMRYKDCMKSRGEVLDLLDYPSVAERVKEIRDAIVAETAPAAGSEPPSTVTCKDQSTENTSGDSSAPAATAGASATADKQAKGFDMLSEEDQAYWMKHIKKTVNTYVARIADTGSSSELQAKITACPLAMMRGDPSGLVVFHFDVKKFGESTTRPDLRVTPLRDQLYGRLVSSVLSARRSDDISAAATAAQTAEEQPQATLGAGEMALVFDGGKRGNLSRLVNPWKGPGGKKNKEEDEAEDDDDADDDGQKQSTETSLLQLVFSAESLAMRKKIVRGTLSLKQIEWCHIITSSRVSLPERSWKNFPGTNCGDTLMGVQLPSADSPSVWKLSWADKKALYGKKHLVQVGGRTEGSKGTVSAKRTDGTIEPTCWHNFPLELYEDLLRGFFVKLVYDLSPADDMMCWACLLHHVACIAVCYTEKHCELLFNNLVERMKVAMAEAGNPMFNPAYAVALGIKKVATEQSNHGKNPKNEKAPKKGKKPTKKAKAKDDDDEMSKAGSVSEAESEVWDPLAA